jgi:quaternary ammonium compound-resistance protein SugE
MINIHWLYLLVAGLFEIGFTYCLKRAENFRHPLWTALFIFCVTVSLWLLNLAVKGIALGTAYAVWTGIGTAGTAILGIVFFNESTTWLRCGLIATLVAAVIGLKVVS